MCLTKYGSGYSKLIKLQICRAWESNPGLLGGELMPYLLAMVTTSSEHVTSVFWTGEVVYQ